MNAAIRKLAMIEKDIEIKEEAAKIAGNCTVPIDPVWKRTVTDIMDKVRFL